MNHVKRDSVKLVFGFLDDFFVFCLTSFHYFHCTNQFTSVHLLLRFPLRLNGLHLYRLGLSYRSFERIRSRFCLNYVLIIYDLMSFYGGCRGTWKHWHGSTKGDALPDDVDASEKLPSTDSDDIGRDE